VSCEVTVADGCGRTVTVPTRNGCPIRSIQVLIETTASPGVATSDAGIHELIRLGLCTVVCRGEPFQYTTASLLKASP
jgi:hypothetical protein